MSRSHALTLLVLCLALSPVLAGGATAADAIQQFTIDFTPLFNLVIWPTLSAIALAVAGVIANRIKTKWGVEVDKKTIETALQSGLQLAQAKVAQANIQSPVVQSKIVADTANYVIAHVPDTLKSLGVDASTPTGLASLKEKIEARLAPAVLVAESAQGDMSVAAAATIANPEIASAPAPVDNASPKA